MEPHTVAFVNPIIVKVDISSLVGESLGIMVALRQELPNAPWLPLADDETLAIDTSGCATLRVRSFANLAIVWFGGERAGLQAARLVAKALGVAAQRLLVKIQTKLDLAVGPRTLTSAHDTWALHAHASAEMLERIALVVADQDVSGSTLHFDGVVGFGPTAVSSGARTRSPDMSDRLGKQLQGFYEMLLSILAPTSSAAQHLHLSLSSMAAPGDDQDCSSEEESGHSTDSEQLDPRQKRNAHQPRIYPGATSSDSPGEFSSGSRLASTTPPHVALRQLARSTLLHQIEEMIEHDPNFDLYRWEHVVPHLDSKTNLELKAYCKRPAMLVDLLMPTQPTWREIDSVARERQVAQHTMLELDPNLAEPAEPSIADSVSSGGFSGGYSGSYSPSSKHVSPFRKW